MTVPGKTRSAAAKVRKSAIKALYAMPVLCGAALVPTEAAQATEGGTNLYILGTGVPGAGIAPPLEGVYASQIYWVYDGNARADRDFILNGNIVADLDATIAAQFNALLWVPSTNVAGGTLSLGAILPVGAPILDVGAVLTGPGGQSVEIGKHDSTLTVGDPVVTAALGWHFDKVHVQLGTMVNIPVGHYREGKLANISLHRWAVDTSLATSWHDPDSGWDITGKVGVTINGKNDYTNYSSGDEFHAEASVEKAFSPQISAGLQGYYYNQISSDKGEGARLGPFKGEVAAVGGTIATNIVMGGMPSTIRVQYLHEFDAKNRLEGDSVFLNLVVPLSLNMPPAP